LTDWAVPRKRRLADFIWNEEMPLAIEKLYFMIQLHLVDCSGQSTDGFRSRGMEETRGEVF
jgi:hypothetical protein